MKWKPEAPREGRDPLPSAKRALATLHWGRAGREEHPELGSEGQERPL